MRIITLFSFALATTTSLAFPSSKPTPRDTNSTIGPEKGYLVIVGGNLQSESIYSRIIALAGGPSASIIVVPTAGGEPTYGQNFSTALTFRELGATNVNVLHTYDPAVADTDAFVAPLITADAVFFGGGRQWRLVDAYAGTKTEVAFNEVLERGGVISGSSAGASIIGSFLARGDTSGNDILVGDHTVGFGYLKNSAIDQHVLVRNRHFDMFQILEVQPELLGIAIDEDTAVVVSGNDAEVIGSTYALIYDGGFWSRDGSGGKYDLPEKKFYFLKEGDRYDLAARRKIISSRAQF
ncbi:class I glutamine amidotransferase-like protein [Bimuria novae-zelandiae CBS 107.79]|uniref:Class I glutamine amidotransferase-like protein n=1 Tax=Bimuria novae-zelandiae CBS 107.79 TaxID=1447943 RepID=A0A6A5VRK8_9PLEO|nr:class I glutamine amidotransferase-like protein [Bimuria novae-zelandiae CBS 107.79]